MNSKTATLLCCVYREHDDNDLSYSIWSGPTGYVKARNCQRAIQKAMDLEDL